MMKDTKSRRLQSRTAKAVRKASPNGHFRTARHFSVPSVPIEMSAEQIAELRHNVLGVSQHLFARMLNVAPQTVRAWEQGGRTPSGSALRLLALARERPETLRAMLKDRTANDDNDDGDRQ